MAKDLGWPAIYAYEQSDTWQRRLKGEYYALVKRIHDLEKYIKGLRNYNPRLSGYIAPASNLPKTPVGVLEAQLTAMKTYRDVLKDRASRESIDL
jgi:hypothetical protein